MMRTSPRLLGALVLAAALLVPAPARAGEGLRLGVAMRSAESLPFAEELAGDAAFSVRVPVRWAPGEEVPAMRLARAVLAAHPTWDVVLNLRYQPSEDVALPDRPGAFARWVAGIASQLDDPRVSFDVTNRANALVPDGASDAGRADVMDALVDGVLAARAATSSARVGFSWIATGVPAADLAWWSRLGTTGGPRFAAAVDFVDVQLYPGTLTPPWPAALPAGFSLEWARRTLMPMALLYDDVPIIVGELGFAVLADPVPFFWGSDELEVAFRTEKGQAVVLRDMLEEIRAVADSYNVESASWWSVYDDDGCALGLCWGLIAQPVPGPDGNPSPPRRRQAFDELLGLVSS